MIQRQDDQRNILLERNFDQPDPVEGDPSWEVGANYLGEIQEMRP